MKTFEYIITVVSFIVGLTIGYLATERKQKSCPQYYVPAGIVDPKKPNYYEAVQLVPVDSVILGPYKQVEGSKIMKVYKNPYE